MTREGHVFLLAYFGVVRERIVLVVATAMTLTSAVMVTANNQFMKVCLDHSSCQITDGVAADVSRSSSSILRSSSYSRAQTPRKLQQICSAHTPHL